MEGVLLKGRIPMHGIGTRAERERFPTASQVEARSALWRNGELSVQVSPYDGLVRPDSIGDEISIPQGGIGQTPGVGRFQELGNLLPPRRTLVPCFHLDRLTSR